MSERRPHWTQSRSCYNASGAPKAAFATKRAAQKAIPKTSRGLAAYECEKHGWHLGTDSPRRALQEVVQQVACAIQQGRIAARTRAPNARQPCGEGPGLSPVTRETKGAQIREVVAPAFGERDDVIGVPPRFAPASRRHVPRLGKRGAFVLRQREIRAAKRATVGSAERANAPVAFGNVRPQAPPRCGSPICVRARIPAPHAAARPDLGLAAQTQLASARPGPARYPRLEFGERDADRGAAMRSRDAATHR